MVITVYKRLNASVEEGDNTQTLEEINIPQIDSLSILHVKEKVGTLLTVQDLRELSNNVEPDPSLQEDEQYARNVDIWRDGCVVSEAMDIPHYIGFRLVANSILRKYGAIPDLLFQIS